MIYAQVSFVSTLRFEAPLSLPGSVASIRFVCHTPLIVVLEPYLLASIESCSYPPSLSFSLFLPPSLSQMCVWNEDWQESGASILRKWKDDSVRDDPDSGFGSFSRYQSVCLLFSTSVPLSVSLLNNVSWYHITLYIQITILTLVTLV